MEDTFSIFYDSKLLVTLTGFSKLPPLPSKEMILDWYAKHYDFKRDKLTGCYVYSISIYGMKYEDFV